MSELNSEYVVKYYNSWTEAKVIDNTIFMFVYIQMEMCSQNLMSLIEIIKDLNEEMFKTIKYFIQTEIFIEIIEGLNELHLKNIIHRDLKPENILISDGKNGKFLKLCDFGLSKVNENSKNTRGIGTGYYMAPELYEEDINEFEEEVEEEDKEDLNSNICRYNVISDIYSLGVIATKIFDFEDKSTVKMNEMLALHEFNRFQSLICYSISVKNIHLFIRTHFWRSYSENNSNKCR